MMLHSLHEGERFCWLEVSRSVLPTACCLAARMHVLLTMLLLLWMPHALQAGHDAWPGLQHLRVLQDGTLNIEFRDISAGRFLPKYNGRSTHERVHYRGR